MFIVKWYEFFTPVYFIIIQRYKRIQRRTHYKSDAKFYMSKEAMRMSYLVTKQKSVLTFPFRIDATSSFGSTVKNLPCRLSISYDVPTTY